MPQMPSLVGGPLEGSTLSAPTSFDILFAPMLQVVSTMRRFVLALYERVLKDASMSAQMALVTHELLENAVKFNTDAGTRLRISLTRHELPTPHHEVAIRTRNRAAPEHIRVAEQLIARVRDTEDPELLYREMMHHSLEQDGRSGRGLARIRAETAMPIEVHTDGDHLEVVARVAVPAGGLS